MSKHYHVLSGLQGCYLPGSNYPCETKAQAIDLAKEKKSSMQDAGYYIIGDIHRNGFYEWGWDRNSGTHMIIEIAECYEQDCMCSECGTVLGLGECQECEFYWC